MDVIPVILCGGSGTRLWPLSRKYYPKQFLSLVNDESMFINTVKRAADIAAVKDPIVITNEDHRFLVAEQLRQAGLSASSILLEPVGRNTAPAIALAAIKAVQDVDDAVLLVLPADHVIADQAAFGAAVEQAAALAETGDLVAFGINPTHAETGYGYIRADEQEKSDAPRIKEFVEKPDAERAESYLAAGSYFWNSGMFVFKASRFISELERFRPDILQACQDAMKDTQTDLDFIRVDAEAFAACPDDSIDYAVMEKTADARVIPLSVGWSDVGSWSALWDLHDKDDGGNVCVGEVININSENCFFWNESKPVAAIGLKDIVIIDTADAVLVANKDDVQQVKEVVNSLKKRGVALTDHHREVFRPWGCYDSVDEGHRYQVKRITVKPGQKLSLQMHHHRAEHWVVVKGSALVTVGDDNIFLTENQSTYIPVGIRHRLENPGVIPLEIIEVQSGSYLGEDDIVRFDDTYGRCD